MSSADGSVRAVTPGQSGLIAAARAGVRETVAESASGGSGRRWLVPLAAAAAVAAAACTPIAWPLLAGGAAVAPAALTALFGQVGGVGGGLLSEAVIRAWDRLHERKHSDAGPGEFQEELANELKEALSSSSADAAGLRAELAGVLQGVDAVKSGVDDNYRDHRACLRRPGPGRADRGTARPGHPVQRVPVDGRGGQRPAHAHR